VTFLSAPGDSPSSSRPPGAAHQLMKTLRRQDELKRLAAEALKYRPDQPRISAGQSGGGQWTDGGGGQVLSDAKPDNFWKPGSQVAQNDSSKPPKIPDKRPLTPQERNKLIKQAAKWLAKTGIKLIPAVRALRIAAWMLEFAPYINAYLDAPKTLGQLQEAVSSPAAGYDIHHIVEQTPAENEGYSRDKIDGRDNLVRVPTLKHWEITGWYARKDEEFGMKSPREYLRGKSWDEKMAMGKRALIDHGVLKP
jgi:hypothetical protein